MSMDLRKFKLDQVLPPLLTKEDVIVTDCNIRAHTSSSDNRVNYTYTLSWTNDGRQAVASPMEKDEEELKEEKKKKEKAKETKKEDIVKKYASGRPQRVMSGLSVKSDGAWTEPHENEMLTTKAVLFEPDQPELLRTEVAAEHPATARLSEVVEELVERAGAEKTARPKIFVCPVKKSAPLKVVGWEEAEKTMVKDLDRHRGKLCLILDLAGCIVAELPE